jgi:hypothetical protein
LRLRIGVEGREHGAAPAPARPHHQPGEGRQRRVGAQMRLRDLVEQQRGDPGQAGGFGFESMRRRQAKRAGQPGRCGQAEPRRPHEGEEFEQVEGGKALDTEPARGRAQMHQQRRFAGQPFGHPPRLQRLHAAVRRPPGRPPGARGQRGRGVAVDLGPGLHLRGAHYARMPPGGGAILAHGGAHREEAARGRLKIRRERACSRRWKICLPSSPPP